VKLILFYNLIQLYCSRCERLW